MITFMVKSDTEWKLKISGVVADFGSVAVMANPAAVAAAVVLSFAVLVNFALHKIEEGHVGVYYRVSDWG